MNPIYKHTTVEGRPLFSEQMATPSRPKESMLGKNPLLQRMRPAKSSSKLAFLFKKGWHHFTQFFKIQRPSVVQENLAATVRPLEADTSLSIGNLWHHYKRFITQDQECPPGLKTVFQKMEQDEKEIFKLQRLDKAKKKAFKKAFINKQLQEIQTLPVGKTKLLLLSRQESLDQSISGDQFCTITRTQKGFTLHFIGAGEEAIHLAGKEKVQREVVFKNIPPDLFKSDPFLKTLLTQWIKQEGPGFSRDLIKNFEEYEKKDLTLEDYTTRSFRADKLFWNILLSIPCGGNTENTRSSIRGLRLRTEILTLYETFASSENVLPYDPEKPEEILNESVKPLQAIIDGAGAFSHSSQEAANELLNSSDQLMQVGYHSEKEALIFEGKAISDLLKTGFYFSQSHTRGTDITLDSTAHALLTLSEKDGFRDFAQKEGRLRKEGQTFQLAMPQDQALPDVLSVMSKSTCVDASTDAKDIYRHYRQVFPAPVRKAMKGELIKCEAIEDFVALFQKDKVRKRFITPPENPYDKLGSYYKARKHIQKEDADPKVVLEKLREKNKAQAEELGLPAAAEWLGNFTYPEKVFEKMLQKVSAAEIELENELQVEQEEEVEAELEEQLEVQQNVEVEEAQSKGKTDLFYPPRIESSQKTSADQIHPAYDAKLFVSEAFLPFERNKTKSPFKRTAFEPSMFNIGELLISLSNHQIDSIIIEDPLRDFEMLQETTFVYDIRTGKVLGHRLFKPFATKIIQSAEFNRLVAQSKFLDGRMDGYSDLELMELEKWLKESDPIEMRRHFKDDILRLRYRDKNRFEKSSSQLGDLFKELMT